MSRPCDFRGARDICTTLSSRMGPLSPRRIVGRASVDLARPFSSCETHKTPAVNVGVSGEFGRSKDSACPLLEEEKTDTAFTFMNYDPIDYGYDEADLEVWRHLASSFPVTEYHYHPLLTADQHESYSLLLAPPCCYHSVDEEHHHTTASPEGRESEIQMHLTNHQDCIIDFTHDFFPLPEAEIVASSPSPAFNEDANSNIVILGGKRARSPSSPILLSQQIDDDDDDDDAAPINKAARREQERAQEEEGEEEEEAVSESVEDADDSALEDFLLACLEDEPLPLLLPRLGVEDDITAAVAHPMCCSSLLYGVASEVEVSYYNYGNSIASHVVCDATTTCCLPSVVPTGEQAQEEVELSIEIRNPTPRRYIFPPVLPATSTANVVPAITKTTWTSCSESWFSPTDTASTNIMESSASPCSISGRPSPAPIYMDLFEKWLSSTSPPSSHSFCCDNEAVTTQLVSATASSNEKKKVLKNNEQCCPSSTDLLFMPIEVCFR